MHTGINNIKLDNANVQQCAQQLTNKLDQICELCPSSKVTVSPILPTKLPYLNEKALIFNRILSDYTSNYNPRVGILNFNSFLDVDKKLLDNRYGRHRNQKDPIHLGSTGIYTLSRLIISKVRNSYFDGRKFNDVLAGKVTNPRAPHSSW